jgi:hypothetical protein
MRTRFVFIATGHTGVALISNLRWTYLGAVPIAASPYLRGFAKGLAEIKTVDYCQKWQKRLL